MLKRWLSVGLILIAMGVASGVTAHADSDDSALATAPNGVTLTGSNAPLVLSPQALSHAQIGPTSHDQVVALTRGMQQFGAVWSTNNHAFRLSRNQTLAAWVYLGAQADGGLAFVLQNDPRLLNAMPQFTTPVAETLGVFGVDTTPTQASATAVSQTAIQNSWALALSAGTHTQTNAQAPGQANSFDVGTTGPYVAAGYPGAPMTYVQHKVTGAWGGLLTPNQYAYRLARQGLLQTPNLTTNRWVHVTLQWDAAARTMTTSVGDRNPRTDAPQTGQRRTVPVNLKRVDPSQTGYARWGITATTGPHATTNPLVVLTRLPQVTTTRQAAGTKRAAVAGPAGLAHRDTSQPTLRLRGSQPVKITPAVQRVTLPSQLTGQFPAATTVHARVNGRLVATGRPDAHGAVTVTLPTTRLQSGTNRVTLWAQAGTHRLTAPVRVTVELVPGQLAFAALSTTSGFQPTKLPTKSELVPRQAGWRIEVQDTRETGSRWTLLAQAGTFVNTATGRRMAGTPVFVNGTTMTPLGRTPTPIMTHTTNDALAAGKTNVMAHWAANTGVLLHAQPGTAAGRYHGTLTWTLTNAPE